MNQGTIASLKTRNAALDCLKGIAAFFVVLGHAITYLDHYHVTAPLWLRATGTLVSAVHVPMFILISGYLCHRQPYGGYLKKKVIKILIPYLTFGVLKLIFNSLISTEHAHGATLWYNIYDLLVLGGAYWFVYCILLIYIAAPIGWRKENESLRCYNARILSILACLIVFDSATIDFGLSVFPETVTVGTVELGTPFFQLERFLMYFPYFLAGMLLKNNLVRLKALYGRYKRIILSASVAVAAGVGYLVVRGVFAKGYLPKLFIAISLMLLLYAAAERWGKAGGLGTCGRYSLQIMFFDSFYRVMLYIACTKLFMLYPEIALLVSALDVVLSVVTSALIKKIPYVRILFGL